MNAILIALALFLQAPPPVPGGAIAGLLRFEGGAVRVDVSPVPPGYTLKSMIHGTSNLLTSFLKVDNAAPPEILLTFVQTQQGTRKVAGRVLGVSNQNLAAAKVVLSIFGLQDVEAFIGTDGSFSFANVAEGTYGLTLKPEVTGVAWQQLRVGAQDITGIEIRVPRLANVSGQIVVASGGPLPPFPMRFTGPAGTFVSVPRDAQGNFTTTLPEGDYELKFEYTSPAGGNGPTALASVYRVKSIVNGGTPVDQRAIRVSAANPPRLTITLETKEYQVSGRVIGTENIVRNLFNSPGLLLSPEDRRSGLPSFRMNLSSDGSFAFDNVPAGSYLPRLLPDVSGFTPDTIRVVDRDVSGLELRLPKTVEIRGRVVLEPGMPPPRYYFEILEGGSRIPAGPPTLQPGGGFTLRIPEGDLRFGITGLSPGFQLKAFAYGSTDLLSTSARISASSVQELVLTFGYAGTWHRVSGRVIGAGIIADPLWRGVQLLSGLVGPFDAQPGADGSFVFPKVPPGSYTLRVNVPPNMAKATSLTIVVDRDLDNLQLPVAPPDPR